MKRRGLLVDFSNISLFVSLCLSFVTAPIKASVKTMSLCQLFAPNPFNTPLCRSQIFDGPLQVIEKKLARIEILETCV